MGRIIKGYWDCSSCGTAGIGGDVRNCPGCGKPRGDDVKFYMKDKTYLSDEEAASVSREADWYCEFCGALNPADAANCKGCGAAKADSEKNYHDLRSEEAAKEAAKKQKEREKQDAANAGKKKKRKIIGIAILALFLIGIISSLIPKTVDAEVTDISWMRSIDKEAYQNVEENDWSLPDGANLHETKREIHHYDQVLDHYDTQTVTRSEQVLDGYDTYYTYEDLGNGNFEEVAHETPRYRTEYYDEIVQTPVYRDEPVYQTKYYYDIWKWVVIGSAQVDGHDHNPTWPAMELGKDEREGTKTETYHVTIKTGKKGKEATYSLSQGAWETINVGDSLKIKTKSGKAQLLAPDGSVIANLEDVD